MQNGDKRCIYGIGEQNHRQGKLFVSRPHIHQVTAAVNFYNSCSVVETT